MLDLRVVLEDGTIERPQERVRETNVFVVLAQLVVRVLHNVLVGEVDLK